MKIFLVILLTFIKLYSIAQLVHIPDLALKEALNEEGYIVSDSLDLKSIQGRLVLDISNKGIKDLNGLQHFDSVWLLDISKNQVDNLVNLPPNLKKLNCSSNKIKNLKDLPKNLEHINCWGNEITSIENLPKNLKNLICGSNKIISIATLPPTLSYLDFRNNQVTIMPEFKNRLKYLNYSNNPINISKAPFYFKSIDCSNRQNCVPNELLDINILNYKDESETSQINSLRVEFEYKNPSVNYKKQETIKYELKNNLFVSDSFQTNEHSEKGDFKTSTNFKNSFNKEFLYDFLKDIRELNMIIQLSAYRFDFTGIPSGDWWGMDCSHCGYTSFKFTLNTTFGAVELSYRYGSYEDVIHWNKNENLQDIESIINWLYFYKLAKQTIPFSNTISNEINSKRLERISEFIKK